MRMMRCVGVAIALACAAVAATAQEARRVLLPVTRPELPAATVWRANHHFAHQARLVAWADGELIYTVDPSPRAPLQRATIPPESVEAVMSPEVIEDFLASTAPLVSRSYNDDPHLDMIQVLQDGILIERRLHPREQDMEAATAFRAFERHLMTLVPTTVPPATGVKRTPPPRLAAHRIMADGSLVAIDILTKTRRPMRQPPEELAMPIPPELGAEPPVFCLYVWDPPSPSSNVVTVRFAGWSDGRVCWSTDPSRPTLGLSWGRVEEPRIAAFAEQVDLGFLESDPSLDLAVWLPFADVGPTHFLADWRGKRLGMRSTHPFFESLGQWFVGVDGSVKLGEFTRAELLAAEPAEYQVARAYWDSVEAAIAELISQAEPIEAVVEDSLWTLEQVSPPAVPGSPVPQPAPGP